MPENLKCKILLAGGMPQAFWYEAVPGAFVPKTGQMVKVPFRSKEAIGIVLETGHHNLDFPTRAILGPAEVDLKITKPWLELLQWVSGYYMTPLPLVLKSALPRFSRDLLLKQPKRKVREEIPDSGNGTSETGLTPNQEQINIIQAVLPAIEQKKFHPFLLHGVTGSGKTLVYLHLAKQAIAQGRQVLVLLPEIALTPQTIGRFREFLQQPVFAMHSGLTIPQRRALWNAMFKGEAQIIVGARSGVLSPAHNLGLIIVDEEHDGSYKQSDPAPRYHARDLALIRGRESKCPVVLGSATPSLESFYAAQTGKYSLLQLQRRATGSPMPSVELVDMREQYRKQGPVPLSIPLEDAVRKTLEENDQIILFLNRRGYSPRRQCLDCGEPQQCPNCWIPLNFHKSKAKLLCHYCGFSTDKHFLCTNCQSKEWYDSGTGIEKVQELLELRFPQARILRLDRDTTSKAGATEKILSDFREKKFNILLGTQMVAKGHDFPSVNLVGVIDADNGLGLPDFRAQERIFQLLSQVAGRAGRHSQSGKVLVQTLRSDNPLFQFAISQDYNGFYQEEIQLRQQLNYPPCSKLVIIEGSSDSENTVMKKMQDFGIIFQHHAQKIQAEILGPGPAAIRKLDGKWRIHILAKGKAANQLRWAVQQSINEFYPHKHPAFRLRVDPDPILLL